MRLNLSPPIPQDLNVDVHSVKMQLMEQSAVVERAKVKMESDRDPEYLGR